MKSLKSGDPKNELLEKGLKGMAVLLTKYEDFIDRVNELGFMTLSNGIDGFPSLGAETPKNIWFTGDPDTDPWSWKDRAAEEKKLAYGCILGGNKGFVSSGMYPLFLKAFSPDEHMEERREDGKVSREVWQLWQLFEERNLLDTGDIRREMGVSKKKGGSRVDSAIRELQQYYYITVSGSRRKTDKFGNPYGWAANVYEKVENWVPAEWTMGHNGLSREEAVDKILETGIAISRDVNRRELSKMLGIA